MTLRACPRRTRVKGRSVAPGKERSVSLVAGVKTIKFYNLRRSEARSGVDDVMPMASTAWAETAAQQTTLLTQGSSISDYLVLQKAVALYS